jgi:aryl-alcohol dehydrogenase-like predicted oxidoreductase
VKRRRLGRDGPEVSALGYGLMSLSGAYGRARTAESLDAIDAALELGIDFFDTAEAYGAGHNEELAGRALAAHRGRIVLATKFGLRGERGADGRTQADGTPSNVRRAALGSLSRLGVDTIDLYYLHRRDPQVPIEETVGAMAQLVAEGKVRWLGLSEVSSQTLRRAHAVHPITAVQSEYSLWTRHPEDGVLATCDELGIGFVPYSPLGRGFLTGRIATRDALGEHDIRQSTPYFDDEHFERNRALAGRLAELASQLETRAAPLALAWLLQRGDHIVPIFGTRRRANLTENARAAALELDAVTLDRIDRMFPRGAASGDSAPRITAHLNER